MKSPSQFRARKPCAFRLPASLLLQAAIMAVCFHGLIAAEGPIAAVQDALKREQFLSGETSGVLDEATRAALRRFQIRSGLPATGEIDTATLQALDHPVAAQPPTVQALPPETSGPPPSRMIVEQDRHFLQKVETGLDKVPPSNVPAASAPVAPPPAEPATAPASTVSISPEPTAPEFRSRPVVPEPSVEEERKTPVAKEKPVKKSRTVASRTPQREPVTAPIANGPSERTESRRVLESEFDPDPVGSHGTRIIRSTTTTTTHAEPRVSVYEGKIAPPSATVAPVVRRAIPVEPRRKEGFFDRIFKGDRVDKDDVDDD